MLNATALVLLLTAALLATLPFVNARDITTYAYVSVAPNPIGVNQVVTVVMWASLNPPTLGGPVGEKWEGFKLNVTKPDGSKETLGPFRSDPVGTHAESYTPTQIGTSEKQARLL